MAGPIRQPIDLEKLSKYIEDNVKDIKTPIDVKQVRFDLTPISAYRNVY